MNKACLRNMTMSHKQSHITNPINWKVTFKKAMIQICSNSNWIIEIPYYRLFQHINAFNNVWPYRANITWFQFPPSVRWQVSLYGMTCCDLSACDCGMQGYAQNSGRLPIILFLSRGNTDHFAMFNTYFLISNQNINCFPYYIFFTV